MFSYPFLWKHSKLTYMTLVTSLLIIMVAALRELSPSHSSQMMPR